jgi:selenide,water dikinase
MTLSARRLTEYSPGGGCACKFPQARLAEVLRTVRTFGSPELDPALLVGLDVPDDAAVYAVDESRAWIISCDFMTPVVDDPYEWGRIAATNALSDVYAMGGRPLFALNLLGWPLDLPDTALAEVLRGSGRAVVDAKAFVVGGHSIVDPVPKFGLVAIGEVDPRRLLTKGGGKAGDLLVLTKPLGVGVIGTAIKRGKASNAAVEAAIANMTRLNADAAFIAGEAALRGGTDVTGFGLIGHLHEMTSAAGLCATIWLNDVPVLPEASGLLSAGYASDGSRRTLKNALSKGWFMPGSLDEIDQLMLADPQTSGGLLLSVSRTDAAALVARLREAGDVCAAVIGELRDGQHAGIVGAERRAA